MFTSAGGVPASAIAAWDGLEWAALGDGVGTGNPALEPVVQVLLVHADRLVVAGVFTSAGGIAVTNGLALWDGAAWAAVLPPNPAIGFANALASDGMLLYVGAELAAEPLRWVIHTWDGAQWAPLGGSAGSVFTNDERATLSLTALAIYGPTLVAGGNFWAVNDVPAANLAAWNGTTWSEFGSGTFGGGVAQNGLVVACNVGALGAGCATCAAGFYGPPCSPCPVGSYAAASATKRKACTPCPVGHTTVAVGSASATACVCAPGFTARFLADSTVDGCICT